MPKNSSAVIVNQCTWEVYVAPLASTFVDADDPIVAPFASLGIVSSDPTIGIDDTEYKITASNACATIRSGVSERVITWKFELAQWTKATVEAFFGVGTWVASGTGERWTPTSLASVEKALLFAVVDGAQTIRIGHGRVVFTADGDITWSTEDSVNLPVKATVLLPATGNATFIDANPALTAA